MVEVELTEAGKAWLQEQHHPQSERDRQDFKYFTNDFFYKQFGHIIIDPSVFTSWNHITSILESYKDIQFYLSPTLIDIIKDGKIDIIYDYFSWSKPEKYEIPEISYSLLERGNSYKIKEVRISSELRENIQRLNLPYEVREILLDQLNFLIEYSILIARYRKTKNYLKKAGVPVIDSANKIITIKRDFIQYHRGVTWLIHLLIKGAQVMQLDEIHPLVDMLFDLTDYVLWVFDP